MLNLIVYQGLSAYFLFTVSLRWTDNKVNTAWSLAALYSSCNDFSCFWWHGSGSICCDWSNHGRKHHVLEKRGWLHPQRRWGFFMHFSLLYCDSFFWCLCEGVKLSVPCFFPLYSSLGISPLEGAQWYASSRRFCHASVLTNYSSILFIKIVAAHPYSKMKLLLMKLWLCMAGCDPIWCWSCGKQRKVTGNPCFCWYDSGRLDKEQGAAGPGSAEIFAWMT